MKWIVVLLVWLCAAMMCACGTSESDLYGKVDVTTPDDPGPIEQPPLPLVCDGLCVETAPATYTGPSLFWIHNPNPVHLCPEETPYPGIQGFVDNPTPLFARECLVTLSDLCGDEGLTCVPRPAEDFQVCIHHIGGAPCDEAYPHQRTMAELQSNMPVTLCCKAPVGPK